MSFADEQDDYETHERNELAADDEGGIYSHDRSGDQNIPDDPVLTALATLNLATLAAMREPDSFDLRAAEFVARIGLETAAWEAGRTGLNRRIGT